MSDMVIKAKSAVIAGWYSFKNRVKRNFVINNGDGWTDLLIKIGIAVLIGGLVIAFINILIPDLFEKVREWIFSLFDFSDAAGGAGGAGGEGG
ncbi:MAG: hypothetical protein IK990_12030 [Ruminiclostridium sp.]|nr:hypothetical protein [Ruminiclostridium sp.]